MFWCSESPIDDVTPFLVQVELSDRLFVSSSISIVFLGDSRSYPIINWLLFEGLVGPKLLRGPTMSDTWCSLMDINSEIDMVSSEQVVKNPYSWWLITFRSIQQWKIFLYFYTSRIGLDLLFHESWRVCNWEVDYFCGSDFAVEVEDCSWSEDIVASEGSDNQYCFVAVGLHCYKWTIIDIDLEGACSGSALFLWISNVFKIYFL